MAENGFQVERFGAVARCSMNHPEKMNALSPETGEPMVEEMGRLMADDTVSVIVLRAEGGNFCTGSDLSLLGDNMDPVFLCQVMKRINAFLFDLHQGAKIVITEVDGYALGGGLGLALASDITVATDQAKFCCGFIRIGAVPDMGTTYFLTERVGMAKAKEIALTGDIVDAGQALAMGLINRVVPRETISEEVMQLATRIAKAPPEALTLTKRNLNRARRIDLQTALDLEAHIQPLMLLSDAHKAAIKKLLS
ncbi:MAG: enoyl-CoA hydratase/isomerase family protein [Desulfobacterales bacterium]|nr:enoyl-CoA hydratase/isomerase family protein [Desulfobacterales bacterium]